MAKNFTGEILHFAALRLRVAGSGNLKTNLVSLSDAIIQAEPDIALQATPSKEPTILSNFNQEMAYIYGKTMAIDEYFVISRIIVYIRPIATGYPI